MSRQPMNGFRNYSNATTTSQASLPASNGRSQSQAPAGIDVAPAQSRAEKFEDEKKRIVDSCFSKTDETGQLQESYITHIRITEDAIYPSTPPPPDSGQENKKPRLIIIAVRNTGRVRMHKARENNNGSFSIGKTWNMEELSAIESFSNIHTAPRDDREAQYRTWAGSVGFIVTITKPYYWQAGTSKEKDFFIASAVKIYKKYTKGAVPELRGFDDKERLQILGTTSAPSSQTGAQPTASARRPSNASPVPTSLQPPTLRDQPRDQSRYRTPGPERDNDFRAPSATPPSNRAQIESPSQQRAYSAAPTTPRQQQPPPQSSLRQYASNDRMRSQSRGPRPSERAQYGAPQSRPYEPLEPPTSIRTQDRSDSPTIAARKRSPSRQRSAQDLNNRYDQQRPAGLPESNGSTSGPALFASTRQRMQQASNPSSTKRPSQTNLASSYSSQQPAYQSIGGAPQLSALATVPGQSAEPPRQQFSPDRTPVTATSGTSSGFDLTDAATIGAITSFWAESGGDQPSPGARDAVSPPTPERSRRRPTMESKPSTSSLDLRPAPLAQARKASTPVASPSAREVPAPVSPPRQVEVKPYAAQNKSEPNSLTALAARNQALNALSASNEPEPEQPASPEQDVLDDDYRPGLGPMIKKKAVANRMLKAANAVNAFKPRPGGAGAIAERILKAKSERDAMIEPDGISAVVPRPEVKPIEPVRERAGDPPRIDILSPTTPASEIEPPKRSEYRKSVNLSDETPRASLQPASVQQEPIIDFPQPQAKIKRRSAKNEKFLTELGIDRSLLEGKGLEFESLLDEFGWRDGALRTKSVTELEQEVKRELGRVEAGSWLSQADLSRDEKVQQVEALLDKTIAECDDLDGLLTLYSVELGSLNEDIAFIEAQSQGLQVQSANQKVLHSELQSLVETMSLSRTVMEPLRSGDMSQPDRLEEVEQSLVKLYDALVTMDPTMKSSTTRPISRGGGGEIELSRMAALREKKEVYARESTAFSQRLMQHLDHLFTTTLNNAKPSVMRPAGGQGGSRLNKDAINQARGAVWMFSPAVLFTKEANPPAWQTIIRMYYTRASPLYLDAFKDNLAGWKRSARKPAPEEAELLFTHQEKETGDTVAGLTSTARKLTVKRSQTLAKTLRNAGGGDKHSSPVDRNPGAMMASEVFAGAMDEMAPLISQEQNFIVDMFHITSTDDADFLDSVHSVPPEHRTGTNLLAPKPMEQDREMSRRVHGIMDEIFTFFSSELTTMLEWAIGLDPLQGVGVMAALSKHAFYLEGTNQEFLLDMLDHLRSKLRSLWNKFIDEQIRAIEDTKVKIHKRKGVISFMKVFPTFSAAVENIFSAVARNDYEGPADCMLEVRKSVDAAYAKLNRAMFDSLKVIAKESPGAPGPAAAKQGGVDDPEDKEMLNYYILIIENMNHYVEEVDDSGKEGVLAEWRGRAMMERSEALEAYIARVVRRPLGKLLDFIESLESLMLSHAQPATITSRPSYSRKSARGILAQFDSKEIRRGIDILRRRIEKHFIDADEEALARSLVGLVTKECERSYDKIMDRAESLLFRVYPPADGDKNVEVEFTREDVRSGFRK